MHFLTPEAPTYSMRAHGGLPAYAGGVRGPVTEQACREYLMQLRWRRGFTCPRCGGQTSTCRESPRCMARIRHVCPSTSRRFWVRLRRGLYSSPFLWGMLTSTFPVSGTVCKQPGRYTKRFGPAIAGGNSVILKPATDTPLVALKFTQPRRAVRVSWHFTSWCNNYSCEHRGVLIFRNRSRPGSSRKHEVAVHRVAAPGRSMKMRPKEAGVPLASPDRGGS